MIINFQVVFSKLQKLATQYLCAELLESCTKKILKFRQTLLLTGKKGKRSKHFSGVLKAL